MMRNLQKVQAYRMKDFLFSKTIALTGPYGTGKTEIALGLALQAVQSIRPESKGFNEVVLGDLDILKPYFRSREARHFLQQARIKVLCPPDTWSYSDLPVFAPELRRYLAGTNSQIILDAAGDSAGAKALGALSDILSTKDHQLLLVINRYRPFCNSAEELVELGKRITDAAQMRITGIVSNTHFVEHTTADDVEWGLDLARRVAYQLEVGVRLLAAPEELQSTLQAREDLPPQLFIRRRMIPQFLGGVALSPGVGSSDSQAGAFGRVEKERY